MDDETRALAATIAHPFSLAHAVDHTALLYLHLRRGTDALVAAEEEIRIATDQGFPLWHSLGLLHKGGALTLQGKAEEGLSTAVERLRGFPGDGLRAAGAVLPRSFLRGVSTARTFPGGTCCRGRGAEDRRAK